MVAEMFMFFVQKKKKKIMKEKEKRIFFLLNCTARNDCFLQDACMFIVL